MPLTAVLALAALTYGFKVAGPLLRGRVTVPAATERLFADAAAVLLIALAVTSALTAGHGFA
ncbi:MAG: AzlD domain-containing protein, partial [Trebonia sp.]